MTAVESAFFWGLLGGVWLVIMAAVFGYFLAIFICGESKSECKKPK